MFVIQQKCLLSVFIMADAQRSGQNGTSAFLTSVVNLCIRSGNNWYRVYLIRKICSQHGVEFVLKLLSAEATRWLFPEEVLQKVNLFTSLFLASVSKWRRVFILNGIQTVIK